MNDNSIEYLTTTYALCVEDAIRVICAWDLVTTISKCTIDQFVQTLLNTQQTTAVLVTSLPNKLTDEEIKRLCKEWEDYKHNLGIKLIDTPTFVERLNKQIEDVVWSEKSYDAVPIKPPKNYGESSSQCKDTDDDEEYIIPDDLYKDDEDDDGFSGRDSID